MFGTEEKKELIKPSQIIESVYPGVYDEYFLRKADEIPIIQARGLTTNLYKIDEDGLYDWHREGKPIADALIAMIRNKNQFITFVPF